MPAQAERACIPLIQIGAIQGRFLQVMMRACNASRVLEVGSLFGYSTLWMARALPAGGKVYALEINPLHVTTIRENATKAGLSSQIEVIEGDARVTLPGLQSHGPFDFAFVDGAKYEYVDYYEQVMALLRPGGIIVADNMSGRGEVWQDKGSQNAGQRALNQRMATDHRLTALLLPFADGMAVGVVNRA